ncbi:MAG TPA: hypothetical protein DIT01_01255 [Lentisphaeria bacterium]|nr:hypothetical protein [Lentisphaeria bacterium]
MFHKGFQVVLIGPAQRNTERSGVHPDVQKIWRPDHYENNESQQQVLECLPPTSPTGDQQMQHRAANQSDNAGRTDFTSQIHQHAGCTGSCEPARTLSEDGGHCYISGNNKQTAKGRLGQGFGTVPENCRIERGEGHCHQARCRPLKRPGPDKHGHQRAKTHHDRHQNRGRCEVARDDGTDRRKSRINGRQFAGHKEIVRQRVAFAQKAERLDVLAKPQVLGAVGENYGVPMSCAGVQTGSNDEYHGWRQPARAPPNRPG